jgi:hypothetical protein
VTAVGYVQDWVLRCAELLDALAEAVTIRGPDDALEYANQAALDMFGFQSIEQLRMRTDAETLGGFVIHDERGQPVRPTRPLPPADAVAAAPASPVMVQAVDRLSGERRWWRFRSTPLHDPDGDLAATLTVIEDLTALKTAETRTRLLAETGQMLASSLDYEQTLSHVARMAVPELADWGAVDLASEGTRELRRVATAAADDVRLAQALQDFHAPGADSGSALRRVIRSGNSVLYRKVTRDQLARWSRSAAQLHALQELDVRSVMIVPMRVPTQTTGAMTFVTTGSSRWLDPDDRALAEQLGRRAAVAVENARLHTRLSQVAETLERSLLPGALPEVSGWRTASLYRPAPSELRFDVGGDFFELFHTSGHWYAIIGDVEGKGVAAATLTALLRYGTRFAAGAQVEPAAILGRLDEVLREQTREVTCTALCLRIESDRVVLSSAGHPPALLASKNGEVRELPAPGPLMGAFEDARWPQEDVAVAPGDVLLLYTDGVTAALGRDRLRAIVSEQPDQRPQQVLRRLDAALREHRRDARADDVAALVLAPA